MDESFAIETDGLTKIYGSGNTAVVAMKDATVRIRRGKVVALLGPSPHFSPDRWQKAALRGINRLSKASLSFTEEQPYVCTV
jgi:hypothetical protein